jgi:peptidyl-prolyl cis-trans isomerase C
MIKLISKHCAAAVIGVSLLSSAASAIAQNAVTVNNKPISKAKVDEFMAALAAQGRPDTPELRKGVIDELIGRELLVQQAEKSGIARSPEVARQLDSARTEIMAQAALRDYMKKNPIKDTDVKAEYDKAAKQSGGKEYKARHILVEKEETAKKIIDDLKKGAKFEEQAKQSKDPGSAANGGDLGWTNPAGLVPPFAEAMVKLAKGGMTETPVQSQFGWHVIKLDDVREAKPPAFEESKAQIQQFLTQKKIQEYIAQLRSQAAIK